MIELTASVNEPVAMTVHVRGDYNTRKVWINKLPLSPTQSQNLRNHSPDGFNWGYGGSGPAQLALAIAFWIDPITCLEWYQKLKEEWVAILPQDNFERILTIQIHPYEE